MILPIPKSKLEKSYYQSDLVYVLLPHQVELHNKLWIAEFIFLLSEVLDLISVGKEKRIKIVILSLRTHVKVQQSILDLRFPHVQYLLSRHKKRRKLHVFYHIYIRYREQV